jgi:hypothetical protein
MGMGSFEAWYITHGVGNFDYPVHKGVYTIHNFILAWFWIEHKSNDFCNIFF